MLKRVALFALLLLLVSGCVTEEDILNIVKADSRVEAFLEENPSAEITSSQWSKSYVTSRIETIREKCGSQMEEVPYRYFLIKKGSNQLEVWLDEQGRQVLCVYEKPVLPDECQTDNECNDFDACTNDVCSGSPKKCTHNVITSCISGDDCCPSNCSYVNDDDCSKPVPTCSAQGGEICSSGETCPNSFIQASDSSRCCPSDCEEGPCKNVDCDPNKKCVDGRCLLKTCSERDGVICRGSKTCSRITVLAAGTSQCCLGECIEPVECYRDSQCDDEDTCTADICSDTNNTCIHTEITECNDDDGCCPADCNYFVDNDCITEYCADLGIEIDGQLKSFKTGDTISGLKGKDAYVEKEFSLKLQGIANIDKNNYGIIYLGKDFRGNKVWKDILVPNKSLANSAYASWRYLDAAITLKSITIKSQRACTEIYCGDGFCSEKENYENCPQDCDKLMSGSYCASMKISVNNQAPVDQNVVGTFGNIKNTQGVAAYSLYLSELLTDWEQYYQVIGEIKKQDGTVVEKAVLSKDIMLSDVYRTASDFQDQIKIDQIGIYPAYYNCPYVGTLSPVTIKGFAEVKVNGESRILAEGDRISDLAGRDACVGKALHIDLNAITQSGGAYPPVYGGRFNLYDEQNNLIDYQGVDQSAELRDLFIVDLGYPNWDYCLDTKVFFEKAYTLVVD